MGIYIMLSGWYLCYDVQMGYICYIIDIYKIVVYGHKCDNESIWVALKNIFQYFPL
jgi:hypothetical protein